MFVSRIAPRALRLTVPALVLAGLVGCASVSNKITGTSRAGSEQLLLTGTSDRAVCAIDFRPLSGAKAYLDTGNLAAADEGWVIFSLRRAMAEHGVRLVSDADDAQVIVEAALGAYGTDEREHGFTLPGVGLLGTMPIPATSSGSTPLCRKNKQDAVVKLALFAYDAGSRQLVWESGTIQSSEYIDRNFILSSVTRRQTSLPELESYPPRRTFATGMINRFRRR